MDKYGMCKTCYIYAFPPYNIKVVAVASKGKIYSICHNTWLNRRCFSSKVLLPFVYIRLLMVDTKSRGYSKLGQLSECGDSGLFFGTRPSLVQMVDQSPLLFS